MPVLEFTRHADCALCDLCEQCKNRGLPTRPAGHPKVELLPPPGGQALLVVGEAPGYNEDLQATSWIGGSGFLLHGMMHEVGIDESADIYLTNACRCHPPQNEDPSDGQLKLCRPFLHADIELLHDAYQGKLTILCAGAHAAKTVLGMSVGKAILQQGVKFSLAKQPPQVGIMDMPVYTTYHPAILLGRKPSLLYTIRDHLILLARDLSGGRPARSSLTDYLPASSDPPQVEDVADGVLSLDIETYGALSKFEQTVFHPRKSEQVDGIKVMDLIQTAALAWLDPEGNEHAVAFSLQPRPDSPIYENHFEHLSRWLQWAVKNKLWLLGQNIIFDLSYLRHVYRTDLRPLLNISTLQVEDVMLWNFLHSEMRPERSLKALARLFNLASYAKQNFDATSAYDPKLLAYNALDAKVNLRARKLLRDAILRDYGPDTRKLQPLCREFCSDLIWTALHMTEAGIPYELPALQKIHADLTTHTEDLITQAKLEHGLIFQGKGSKKSIQDLINEAATVSNARDRHELKVTPKTKEVSTKDSNITLISNLLPSGHPLDEPLSLLRDYRSTSKIVSTYTKPLLTEPSKGLVDFHHREGSDWGMAYPTWYICPSRYESAEDEGGTIQGRITCKGPAKQTEPKSITACETSRFSPGTVLLIDLSQIELRVAALLSGDPVMLDEYARGLERHALMGDRIYSICTGGHPRTISAWKAGQETGVAPETCALFRQIGKTTNFLVIYEGHPDKLVETIQDDTGYTVTRSQAAAIIDEYNRTYLILRQWQTELIRGATRRKYTELITGWSRLFLGPKEHLERQERATIVNHPVQTTAAQLMLSTQACILRYLESHHELKTAMDKNVYDAVRLDCPAAEADLIAEAVHPFFTRPPLLAFLEDHLGRSVPITYDIQRKDYRPNLGGVDGPPTEG